MQRPLRRKRENNGFPEYGRSGLRVGPNKNSGRDRPGDGSNGSG
ncbi:hypothetical protein P5E62_15605 [Clostridium perfringens]|nr:hypothetical protein [Clostridium perfringens]